MLWWTTFTRHNARLPCVRLLLLIVLLVLLWIVLLLLLLVVCCCRGIYVGRACLLTKKAVYMLRLLLV
jgi:hypothetical protein